MAEVYVGRHVSEAGEFGPMVAVKRLLPHLLKDSGVVRMFLNEARITSQVRHPNVVRIVELGQQAGEPFIAMELLEGRTFAELRSGAAEDGKRIPTGVMLKILSDASLGLDAGHRALDENGQPLGLVHRDFTPDNIHVGVDGSVKVIDFGVARTDSWSSGTEPGTLKGKFFYMPPEMVLGKPVDYRTDVFAAGVMLYEQICGHRPFTGSTVEEVVTRIAQGNPKKPTEHDPSASRALENIALTAIAHDPGQRFQSLMEMVELLSTTGLVGTTEEVAAYVQALFPPEDSRRQTLRRARELDPSTPHRDALPEFVDNIAPQPLASVTTPATSSPVSPQRPAMAGSTELSPAHRPPQQLASSEPVRSALLPNAEPEPRSKLPLVLLALGVLGAGGAFAFFKLRPPSLGAAEALAAAQATADASQREKLLSGIQPAQLDAKQWETGAKLLEESKAYDALLEWSAKWQQAAPGEWRAFLAEGKAATSQRKGKRAEAALSKAAQLAPAESAPELALAELRRLQGDASGALDALEKASKKKALSPEAQLERGMLLSQLGKLDDAATVLETLLVKDPKAEVLAELGFVRFRQERVEDAASLLKRALKKSPDSMVAHYYLGAVQYRQGDVKAARASYLTADAKAGKDTRALEALCELDVQQQSPELAETKALIQKRFPDEAQAILTRCAP